MHVRIYAGLVISPSRFPGLVEILIFPLNRETNQPLGGNFPMIEHHSREWARNQYPLGEEDEKELRAGRRVNVFTGYVVGEFLDELAIPDGVRMERLD
jgi:hypothetical protein